MTYTERHKKTGEYFQEVNKNLDSHDYVHQSYKFNITDYYNEKLVH